MVEHTVKQVIEGIPPAVVMTSRRRRNAVSFAEAFSGDGAIGVTLQDDWYVKGELAIEIEQIYCW